MATLFFIGDEVTAAGFRLAGAEIRVPGEGDASPAFAEALGEAELVLITMACAAELDPADLGRSVRRATPLVLVVPDAVSDVVPQDLGAAVDRVLGIAE